MSHPGNTNFHHRHNENGSMDSICLHCYLTVASDPDEQQLFFQERDHYCDPLRLHQLASAAWPLSSSMES